MLNEFEKAKPFVKWAGGKSQLLLKIQEQYPQDLGGNITKYCEPFVGGGAVLLDVLQKYKMEEILINDINSELINTYECVRDRIEDLIEFLQKIQDEYYSRNSIERALYYYQKREIYNLKKQGKTDLDVEIAALFLFLNKTCFNGLYRVNLKGYFNVPIGNYRNPLICDISNLCVINQLLQNVSMKVGTYEKCNDFIDEKTFLYIDPPYRPISLTSSFNAYANNGFGDDEQIALASFVKEMDLKGAIIVMSNSDPKNYDLNDDFFDDIYSKFSINRIEAMRMINSNASKRGFITELLISNK